MTDRRAYMQRAIHLAYLGAGHVSPNPMVGAVIVHNNRIIGEGWHKEYGGPHAESHALNSVTQRHLLPESTLYVTLEPCSHYGKTPPCANAIVASGIRKVVVGITDPNPLVAGSGIRLLREHGVEVTEDVLKPGCTELNKRFITGITRQRPYIILKWAQTANGLIAPDAGRLGREAFDRQRHITGLIMQKLTHKWRTEEDALMVGTNTVATDNPRLDARAWEGRSPLRAVLDLKGRLARTAHVFDGSQPTVVFTLHENLPGQAGGSTRFIGITHDQPLSRQVADALYGMDIRSLIIEGGAMLLQTFINDNLWDEAQVLTSPKRFDHGVKAPQIGGSPAGEARIDTNLIQFIRNR